jgi:hypothetical protein
MGGVWNTVSGGYTDDGVSTWSHVESILSWRSVFGRYRSRCESIGACHWALIANIYPFQLQFDDYVCIHKTTWSDGPQLGGRTYSSSLEVEKRPAHVLNPSRKPTEGDH